MVYDIEQQTSGQSARGDPATCVRLSGQAMAKTNGNSGNRMARRKNKVGGAREGAGRPAQFGPKAYADPIRLTEDARLMLDSARGEISRSDFIEALIRAGAKTMTPGRVETLAAASKR